MPKMEEKILTRTQVKKLGLDKISVITDDMLDGYTACAFRKCNYLTSITLHNSVTKIEERAFFGPQNPDVELINKLIKEKDELNELPF